MHFWLLAKVNQANFILVICEDRGTLLRGSLSPVLDRRVTRKNIWVMDEETDGCWTDVVREYVWFLIQSLIMRGGMEDPKGIQESFFWFIGSVKDRKSLENQVLVNCWTGPMYLYLIIHCSTKLIPSFVLVRVTVEHGQTWKPSMF